VGAAVVSRTAVITYPIRRCARTCTDGEFVVEPIDGSTEVVVIHKNHAPLVVTATQVRSALENSRGEIGELRLEPGPRISGVVVDSDGRPLAGASVRAVSRVTIETESDPLGLFELPPLGSGTTVRIGHVGYSTAELIAPEAQ